MACIKPKSVLDLLAGFIIVLALCNAILTTYDLEVPPRWDFYREQGTIHNILEGYHQADPLYLNETAWYNPLVPEIVAFVSRFFDLPIPCFFTRFGAYLNLLVPIAFYLFHRRIFFQPLALCALGVFLFWIPDNLPLNTASHYSPWLWPRNFAIGLFYISLFSLCKAKKESGLKWPVLSGLFVGLAFLAHTAPAVLLAGTACWIFLYRLIRSRKYSNDKVRYDLIKLFIIGGFSLLTASYYLLPLIQKYQMVIVNTAPMDTVGMKPKDLLKGLVSLKAFFAFVGFYCILKFPDNFFKDREDRRIFLTIFFITVAFFFYGAIFGLFKQFGIKLIQLVPAYHFYKYLKCFESSFAAVGLMFIALRISTAAKVKYNITLKSQSVLAVLSISFILLYLPQYFKNSKDKLYREESLSRGRQQHITDFYNWALKNTNINDVFLADDNYGLHAVSATGRKAVAIHDFYSNPYVDFRVRSRHRKKLYDLLREKNFDSFKKLAAFYKVKYVINAADAEEGYSIGTVPSEGFSLKFESGQMQIYQIIY